MARTERFNRTLAFFVPLPDTGALQQVANLAKAGDVSDAFLIGKMEVFPRAVWLTGDA
ncbi:MAG: hypothetical protein JO108_06490 [Acidobacteriaceae bacterium]|nr:hypothetical protein [Acidobacteriaceae bacterium]